MITKDQLTINSGRTRQQNKDGGKEKDYRTRPQRNLCKAAAPTDLLDIGRMNTEEYDIHVLGEGQDPKNKQAAVGCRKEKKESGASKFHVHLKLNEEVVNTVSVHEEGKVPSPQMSVPDKLDQVKKNLFQHNSSNEVEETGQDEAQTQDPSINNSLVNKFVQTDAFKCTACTEMLEDWKSIIKKYSSGCDTDVSGNLHDKHTLSTTNMKAINTSSQSDTTAEEMVPLVKGSTIKVPLIKKSNLKLHVTAGDPQEMVNHILEWFYTPLQLANMTADGKTGGARLDINIADAIMTFIHNKYDASKFNFDAHLFKIFVNAKCYNERKKLWKTNPQMPGLRPKKEKRQKEGPPKEHASGSTNKTAAASKTKASKKLKVKSPPRATTGGKKPRFSMVGSASEFMRRCAEKEARKNRTPMKRSPRKSSKAKILKVYTSTPKLPGKRTSQPKSPPKRFKADKQPVFQHHEDISDDEEIDSTLEAGESVESESESSDGLDTR